MFCAEPEARGVMRLPIVRQPVVDVGLTADAKRSANPLAWAYPQAWARESTPLSLDRAPLSLD